MEIGEAAGCLIAHGGAAWLSTRCRQGGGASSAEELLPAQCGSCCPAVLPRAPALTHSASAVRRAQLGRCHPPPPPPLLTMNKGSLNPNPRFGRGEACRAPPALVSWGLTKMMRELSNVGGWTALSYFDCGMFGSLLHMGVVSCCGCLLLLRFACYQDAAFVWCLNIRYIKHICQLNVKCR